MYMIKSILISSLLNDSGSTGIDKEAYMSFIQMLFNHLDNYAETAIHILLSVALIKMLRMFYSSFIRAHKDEKEKKKSEKDI